jgi:predicted DNA-binding protein
VVSKTKGNQTQVTSYYDPRAVKQLQALSDATRIPKATYLREALEDLLKKYASALRKAPK